MVCMNTVYAACKKKLVDGKEKKHYTVRCFNIFRADLLVLLHQCKWIMLYVSDDVGSYVDLESPQLKNWHTICKTLLETLVSSLHFLYGSKSNTKVTDA